MRVAIYGRLLEAANAPFIQQLLDALTQNGIEVVVYRSYLPHLENKVTLPPNIEVFKNHHEIANAVDYLLSLGGDGTLLDTVPLIRDSQIPVMGINLGRLGFLSSVGKELITEAVDSLQTSSFSIEQKDLVKVEANHALFEGANFGLNEFTIHKRDIASMVVIHAAIDGDHLNSYWCDGLIIATPTGSTAYSLSCGGPILAPNARNFVITPIAPHHLTVRPVVVPDSSVLTLTLEGQQDSFLCSLDSRSEVIDSSFTLTIKKESFSLNLVRLSASDYLTTLRTKLLWGFDKRNK